ncbi:MAG: ribosome biogenesis GTP-binding protein YihA/YsxC, partial [Oscillospiraceae bacterium]|nr:ribosome biogenesis GTP-binding protein YihA/YsxC [Oscillospiraceae bacterium]
MEKKMNLRQAEFELAAGAAEQLPPCVCPEIVFAGRSNVGKSSLINKLCERKALARVSGQPGKTANINFYGCGGVKLVDLPGYGYAKVSHAERERWGELIEGYFAQNRDVRLVVSLVDSRHKPTADDLLLLDFLTQIGLPKIVALTKIDKLSKTERQARLDAVRGEIGDPDVRIIP